MHTNAHRNLNKPTNAGQFNFQPQLILLQYRSFSKALISFKTSNDWKLIPEFLRLKVKVSRLTVIKY